MSSTNKNIYAKSGKFENLRVAYTSKSSTDVANLRSVQSTFNYLCYSGSNPASDRHLNFSSWGASYDAVSMDVLENTILQEIYVRVLNAAGAGESHDFEIYKNGAATGITLSIPDTDTSASLKGIGLAFVPLDTFTLYYTRTGGAPSAATINHSYKFYL